MSASGENAEPLPDVGEDPAAALPPGEEVSDTPEVLRHAEEAQAAPAASRMSTTAGHNSNNQGASPSALPREPTLKMPAPRTPTAGSAPTAAATAPVTAATTPTAATAATAPATARTAAAPPAAAAGAGTPKGTDAKVESAAKASMFQMAQQVAGLALFVWSWLKCWGDTVVNAQWIVQEGYDIKYAAPVGVLLVGVVMTSIIGVLEFRQEGDSLGASFAAVDLDTPFVIFTQAKPIVQGQDVKSWQKLQMRNAIWRSVPLACITFFLALRDLVEIPACQFLSCVSILGTGLFNDDQGPFLQAATAQNLNVSRVFRWIEIRKSTDAYNLTRVFEPSFRKKFLDTEEVLWKSAHCGESLWHAANKFYLQDLSETWFLNPVARAEDGRLGGLGTGNLLTANLQFLEMTQDKIGRNKEIHDIAIALTYKVGGTMKARKIWLALKMMPFPDVVSQVFDQLREDTVNTPNVNRPVRSVRQERPHWQWGTLQAFVLLLNAVTPMILHVRKERNLQKLSQLACVGVHAMLDMVLLVVVLTLSASSAMIEDVGGLLESLSDHMIPIVEGVLRQMDSLQTSDALAEVKTAAASVLSWQGPEMMEYLQSEVAESLMMHPSVLAKTGAGVMMFVLASYGMTKVFTPEGLDMTARLNVTITGPLYLLSVVQPDEVSQICTSISTQIILRSFLLTSVLASVRFTINPLHAANWYGLVFNSEVRVGYLQAFWGVAIFLHAASGLLAVGHIRQQADEDEEPEEGSGAEAVPPRQGAAAPLRGPPGMAALKSMYGTFLPNKGFPAATPPAASPPSRPPGM